MNSLRERIESTPLYAGNGPFVESLYESWLEDPASVPDNWRRYFEGMGTTADRPRLGLERELAERAGAPRAPSSTGGALDGAAQRLLDAWRLLGHLTAPIDPLGLWEPLRVAELEPAAQGLGERDLSETVETDWGGRRNRRRLGDLYAAMKKVHGGTLVAEFTYVSDPEEWHWLADHVEGGNGAIDLTADERRGILAELTAAEGLEKYLHRRYVGQKRFSLEGGDALIPMLNDLIRRAGADGVKEIVIGMAHRGRLNVLVNILGKPAGEMISEFEGSYEHLAQLDTGDVKYHLGFSSDVATAGGAVHLALAFNPSHLEAVDPVVEGSVRARQDRGGDGRGALVMPVLVHGDASVVGQGVVMETLQMSQTRGFRTGGTVHIVLNNQIGFTISDLRDARSSRYCTDVAKMLEAPVWHVNGDDAEAVVAAVRLAFAYRRRFGKDAFVDLVCYRRQGHNEADEPAVTQPQMYEAIRKHPTPREIYAKRLIEAGLIDEGQAGALADRYNEGLERGAIPAGMALERVAGDFTQTDWSEFRGQTWEQPADTSVSGPQLHELGERLFRVPDDFTLHERAERVVAERRKMIEGEVPLDWGCAENLAYASLVVQGHPVRFTGQDSARGTFFHRHAVYYDANDGRSWIPLNHLAEDQAPFMIYDSLLSEEAVIGFEYGYATARPRSLVIWEAQYGDFANNAQVMIDQFISSGEAKWGLLCGLTLLLPHGYEGAGPEHSSARLERYLQLCAGSNMQVCVPTTAAQIFHLLRRQVIRRFRAPLVVMTPKSLLRHKLAASSLEDLAGGKFHLVIPETEQLDPRHVRRAIFCSGKVYYELLSRRRKEQLEDVAIVRIEQLYPFPREAYAAELELYRDAREIVWCQEEPENQGAWYQIRHRLQEPLTRRQTLIYAGRSASAAPATGYAKQHHAEERALVEEALGLGARDEARIARMDPQARKA